VPSDRCSIEEQSICGWRVVSSDVVSGDIYIYIEGILWPVRSPDLTGPGFFV
jgi:hypothetical protein